MTEYRQTCPEGSGPACVLCGGRGTLQGNGSAQTNPIAVKPALGYAPIWENMIRANEEAS